MPEKPEDVVIVSAVRTPIGSFMGTLSDLSPGLLGAAVVQEATQRAGIAPDQLDEVILGCILTAGHGQNVARQAAIWGGVPVEVPAYTVNKMCASGMKAVILAAQAIKAGDASAVLAGGMESMSASAHVIPGARKGLRLGSGSLVDTMIQDGLTDAFNDEHLALCVEKLAAERSITRTEQDAFAHTSQIKAAAAIQNDSFKDEIIPIQVSKKKGDSVLFAQDEHPRCDCTREGLAKLKPAFKPNGTITAGNASGISDGAAALVLMSRSRAQALGIRPLAAIRSYAVSAVDPACMALGPVPATHKALAKAGLGLNEIDLFEVNEAFAAQCIAVQQELGIPPELLNVNGGAIALGHPIGASGARIVVTLLYELIKRGAKRGLATLCVGGGMGSALILERE
jgi:acetyl-CoA C-acetyltransferase